MKPIYLIPMMVLCLGGRAYSQATGQNDINHTNGQLISTEAYQFPSWETAVEKTDAEKYSERAEYQSAVADENFEFSKLHYLSDGLNVVAYLYKPVKVAAKLPVIVFNRGSFIRGDIAPELISMFHRLASAGFIVIAPMYRQSDGGEGRDEMGGGDLNDLMNVVPLINTFAFADTARLFLYGESRGGVMTYMSVKRGFPARGASVFGAITDMGAYIEANSRGFTPEVLGKIWPGFEVNKTRILKDRSALAWPAELDIPVLIMHGGNDRTVNPLQSLKLAEKLQESGLKYQMKIYAGDNHILSANQVDRDRETIEWFKSLIK